MKSYLAHVIEIMLIPFILFWVLIFLGREELGVKGGLIAVAIWAALLIGFVALNVSPYIFVSAQAMFDVVLILIIFGGDIKIR
jgi:hypothetical protein